MKVLIVDDSATIRRVLKMGIINAIKDKKVEILEATNGQEGLDVIKENLDIDFVFLDINMPIMGGEQMLYIMRNSTDMLNMKVIMQTTEGIREKVKKFTAMGVSGYILKPYTQETVAKVMKKLMIEEVVPA